MWAMISGLFNPGCKTMEIAVYTPSKQNTKQQKKMKQFLRVVCNKSGKGRRGLWKILMVCFEYNSKCHKMSA